MVPPEVNTAIFCVLSAVRECVAGRLDTLDEAQPAFQARSVGAGQPALDDQGEDALELARFLRGVAQDVQGFGSSSRSGAGRGSPRRRRIR
jgi:hypothetical protein